MYNLLRNSKKRHHGDAIKLVSIKKKRLKFLALQIGISKTQDDYIRLSGVIRCDKKYHVACVFKSFLQYNLSKCFMERVDIEIFEKWKKVVSVNKASIR